MELRKYRTEDLPQIARLFRDTIRTINTRDYTVLTDPDGNPICVVQK